MEFLLSLAAVLVLAWIGARWLDDYEARLTEPEGDAPGKLSEERELFDS